MMALFATPTPGPSRSAGGEKQGKAGGGCHYPRRRAGHD